MGSYALIKSGKVQNTIVWDGPKSSPMEFGEGIDYIKIPDDAGTFPSTGWLFDGSIFTPPPITDEEREANQQAAIAANIALKQSLMEEASGIISVLQDAVDLDMATEEEASELPSWKKYRVLLNRIDSDTPAVITWPDKPKA
ncbi:tail fiber assembly protein [Pantoea sp. GCM10028869]|uniref:tail fiber assembly protein n=1 Tax=Pantoea sp. GCM10028869 TaxID=3273417 RepID=UPI003623F003